MRRAFAAAVLLLGGCGSFDPPEIVLDLRILGMRADPPEVVVDVGDDPEDVDLSELPEVEICSLIADPNESRRLVYDLVACAPTGDGRCDDPDATVIQIENGVAEDPEQADAPAEPCGTLVATPALFDVLVESVEADPIGGFDGVPVQIQLAVRPEGAPAADTVYGVKEVFIADRRPPERRPNENPSLEGITALRPVNGERGRDFELPLGRCRDIDTAFAAPGEELTLLPREPEGVRETYVLPTFDGGSRTFTEVLRYAWYATEGKWNRFQSGGPRDAAGNVAPLDSTWTAPADPEVVGDGIDVPLWFVQRDERGGLTWYQSCVRVEP